MRPPSPFVLFASSLPCSCALLALLLARHCGDLACLGLTTSQTANNPNPACRPAAGLDLGSERTPPPLGGAFREAASGERPTRGGLLVEIPVPRVRRAALAAVLRCYGADGTWRDSQGGGGETHSSAQCGAPVRQRVSSACNTWRAERVCPRCRNGEIKPTGEGGKTMKHRYEVRQRRTDAARWRRRRGQT